MTIKSVCVGRCPCYGRIGNQVQILSGPATVTRDRLLEATVTEHRDGKARLMDDLEPGDLPVDRAL